MNLPDLSDLTTAVSQTHGLLIAALLRGLPTEKVNALDGVLASGGSVGLEVMTDGHGRRRISLIAIEQEGTRRMLAEIS